MTGVSVCEREAGKTDGLLLLTVFVLAGFGLLVLYSMSAYNGQVGFGDAAYYLKKQLFAMLFGFCLMYGIARLDYHTLERFAVPAYLASLALSGAVLLFGDAYNGSDAGCLSDRFPSSLRSMQSPQSSCCSPLR